MKILKFIAILLLFSIELYGQKVWTLEDCVKRAIEKNISVKQAESDLEIAVINKQTAFGAFLPTLNANTFHSWNMGLNQNITTGILEDMTTQSASISSNVNLNLFSGLTNLHQLYKANLSVLANEYQLANIKENVSLLVANAYLQILLNKEILTVQESHLNIAKEELIIANEQLKSGVIPNGDVLEIEANLANTEQNLVIAKNNYLLSKIALAQLLLIRNLDDFKVAEQSYSIPDSEILNLDIKTIYNAALSKRNDIKLAKTNLKIAKKDLALSRASLLPRLNGFYSYNSRVLFDIPVSFNQQLDINSGETFGLQLTIPILNNLTNNSTVKLNKIKIQKSKYAFEEIRLELQNTINKAYYDALGSLKSYQAAEKTLLARRSAYNYAKERFNTGVINTFHFLQAQQAFESAESELIKTKYDYIFKLKVLEFYFGMPNLY